MPGIVSARHAKRAWGKINCIYPSKEFLFRDYNKRIFSKTLITVGYPLDPNLFTNNSSGKVILTPTGYWAFIPAQLPPKLDWTPVLESAHTEAVKSLADYSAIIANYENDVKMLEKIQLYESIFSSRIEGLNATVEDIYISRFTETHGKHFRSTRPITNYAHALRYGVERLKTIPISLRFLLELHEILFSHIDSPQITPGEFRRSQNWIGQMGVNFSEATYVPPPVNEMRLALDNLERYIYDTSSYPDLIRIGLLHYQFEAIHPLLDGNGRIGRLLIQFLLYQYGLLPYPAMTLSAYFLRHHQEYYSNLLTVSQKGSWEKWLLFFLQGITEQSKRGISQLTQLCKLRSSVYEALDSIKTRKDMDMVGRFLLDQPIFNQNLMKKNFGFVHSTILLYSQELESHGLTREITGNKRNMLYQMDMIINEELNIFINN